MNPYKSTTPQEKAQSVSWFIETKSDLETLQNYRTKYGRGPPPCSLFVYGTEIYIDRDSV